ncbi:MAG: hypothetical protein K2U26_19690 [Cyclobacteriaceae bacterium]|nr:hypothetical protein [Cyclobacteriaceae bacterium]
MDLAVRTGNQLLSNSYPGEKGVRWFMDSSLYKQNYYMPNFSHGTAGVGYFLARLYQKTNNKQYLDKALTAAAHLEAIENENDWIRHDDGNGKDVYYLSWCHGPVGTARFYYELYRVTQNKKWLDKIKTAAKALMTCGIPQQQTPGFWNNAGPCCGSAGVAEFFLDLHRIFGDAEYLQFSQMVTADVINKATVDDKGTSWLQAEHRRQPNFLQAQTGYMQGAAGIGLWLMHLYESDKKLKPVIVLPDKSF